ncbi:hypothetical protein ACIPRD_10190 [Streptomyces sp. NPDC090108]|uniref:hypothetical protein n=1 Tax=Streptomyces sp. NPDC090108 TaxID=3365947 RepID=UPI00382BAE14
MGLDFPQPSLQFSDLCAEVVGHGPGGVRLDAERVEQGLNVHAVTVCGSRQAGVFAPVSLLGHDLGHRPVDTAQ